MFLDSTDCWVAGHIPEGLCGSAVGVAGLKVVVSYFETLALFSFRHECGGLKRPSFRTEFPYKFSFRQEYGGLKSSSVSATAA